MRDGGNQVQRRAAVLTAKQRHLVRELDEICSEFGLDFYDIKQYEPEARTPLLELAKNHLVRGEVVMSYTLIDEFLSAGLCHYFFGKTPFQTLWKTKRFKVFNYHVLETLTLLEKLSFVGAVWPVPKAIARNVREINALRNGLAHSFFPQNRRTAKPVYKGKDIFTLDGLRTFKQDRQRLYDWFTAKVYVGGEPP